MDIFEELTRVLRERRGAAARDSYVASLYDKGLNKILEKVGEEAVETILAAKDATTPEGKEHLASEVADLWFHTMVMMIHLDVEPARVLGVLEERFGISGHEEKRNRPPT